MDKATALELVQRHRRKVSMTGTDAYAARRIARACFWGGSGILAIAIVDMCGYAARRIPVWRLVITVFLLSWVSWIYWKGWQFNQARHVLECSDANCGDEKPMKQ
jgi:hypothetical protein